MVLCPQCVVLLTATSQEISAEVADLEKQRDELEATLKKVNISLAAANARLRNAREERDQFYEANDQIVAHLKIKEDELSRSVGSCAQEADVLRTWMNFLEDTWALQSSTTETKENEVRGSKAEFNRVVLLQLQGSKVCYRASPNTNCIVGMRKTLVFYKNRAPNGI